DEAQRQVAEIVSRILDDDTFAQLNADIDRSFLYRGVDSLRALELVAELQQVFDLGPEEIPNTFVFDHPTVRLAAHAIRVAKGSLPATCGGNHDQTGAVEGTVGGDEHRDDDDDGGAAREPGSPLAIVGIACRFPGGANSPERFWDNLKEGVDAVTEIPPARMDLDSPVPLSKVYVRKGALLSDRDVGEFDNALFDVPPAEAAAMDPQQRLVLHVVYESLRAAGYDKKALSGMEAGVFVGNSAVEWSEVQAEAVGQGVYGRSSTASAALANRVSHVLGLRGTSLSVDTSCSSSLVAVDLACQAVRQGRCRMAVVAGVQFHLSEKRWIQLCATKMLSPTERCRPFDAAADGMVRGEGAASVVIMPLDQALAEGRPVY
ncbi:polyketide synthase, partial [Diaporthe sp. PMI_573]